MIMGNFNNRVRENKHQKNKKSQTEQNNTFKGPKWKEVVFVLGKTGRSY